PEFLRTHPVTASRISDTRGRAETYPYKQYPDTLSYQLTKAKVRVLTAIDAAEVAKYFQSRLSQGTTDQRIVARYGMGLATLKTQKFKEAEAIFQQLAKEFPNQAQYASALARTALESRDYSTALIRYQTLAGQYPENEAIKLEYISCLLKTNKPEQAKENLLSLNPETRQLPVYWQLLAQIYSDLKQPAESHRYLAEYYYATGQTQDAILQIKLAQKSKGLNIFISSILNERLNFFLTQEQEARHNR
ncbi:MAG: tetratricopeptide repeat protein, partial [Methylovulum sp.]|nr:tetratricopeptide repeat protein [Methylovulum sp.]